MKNILTLILLVIGYNITFAQQDPEAKKILDKVAEKTKSHHVISMDFKVMYKSIKDNSHNTSEGTIILKDDKYRLKFMGSESFFDGKTMWNYLPDEKEVNITEPDSSDEDIFNNPRKLFTIYENNYKYQLIETATEGKTNYAFIDLYPMNINEDYSRIRLQINIDKYFLSSATIFGKDGSHYTISISNYKTNKDIDDSYFTFDKTKYPDVEVIDMRL